MKRSLLLSIVALQLLFAVAQPPNQLTQLPMDSQIRYGKLPNGLTYYIRHNPEPRQRAEFYIAQKVGSMQEEDNQRGLAHFLEHMAFNGTKNFPQKTMLNYLESIGAKFGANVNAYTSFDETVYNLSDIPTTRTEILDSCLLVLHDWANGISLLDKEIDNERAVIKEEWRTRSNGQMRMFESLIPQMYPESKYSNRLPIGDTAIINNFSAQELRDYYHKWYRPDLQGLLIVGDFDAARMEEQVKKMFSSIPRPEQPAERVYYPVQDNNDPLVAVASDKELTSSSVTIYFKHNTVPDEVRPTVTNVILNYMKSIVSTMLNARFNELVQRPNPPFIGAGSNDGRYLISATKDAFTVGANCKESGVETALQSLLEELQRVKNHGFTLSEYERARAEVLSYMENIYNERNKRSNASYISEYVDHFLNGGYVPGVEMEYDLYQKIAPEIPIEQINQMMQNYISDRNVVITISVPEKEGFTPPTREEILATYDMMKDWEVEPYEDNIVDRPLIAQMPKAGNIVSTENNARFDTKVWKLSNGATIVLKNTDFKEDQIVMNAVSLGGSSLVPDNHLPEIRYFNDLISLGGIGDFSAIDLQKLLAGKRASASLTLGTYTEALTASCSPKDLETMMQLVYLTFSAQRRDTDAFRSYTERLKDALENREANPMIAYSDSINKALFGNHPRARRIKAEDIAQINYESVLKMQRDRYKYASDFTFIFVGNIDEQALKPLVEQYIASLSGTNKHNTKKNFFDKIIGKKAEPGVNETYRDLKMVQQDGVHTVCFDKKMETPKATISKYYAGTCKYSLENLLMATLLKNILDIVYVEKIREEEGGTYNVGVSVQLKPSPPKDHLTLEIGFNTNKEQADKLSKIVDRELLLLANEGPRPTDLAKAKEYLLKRHAQSMRNNAYWLNTLYSYYLFGVDEMNGYEQTIKIISGDKMKKFVADLLLKQKNVTEVIMMPAE